MPMIKTHALLSTQIFFILAGHFQVPLKIWWIGWRCEIQWRGCEADV